MHFLPLSTSYTTHPISNPTRTPTSFNPLRSQTHIIIASFHYTCKYGDFRYGTSWVHIQLLCLANCTFNDRSSSDTNAETDIRSVRKLQNFLQFQKTAPGSSLLFRRNLAQRTNLYSVKEPPHSSSHGRPIYAENVVDLKKPASLAEKSWLSCI